MFSTGNGVAMIVFIGIPALCLLRLFGVNLNITLACTFLSFTYILAVNVCNLIFFGRVNKIKLGLISDYSTIIFAFFTFFLTVLTLGYETDFPFLLLQHLLVIAIICPIFYHLGVHYGMNYSNWSVEVTFWILIFIVSSLIFTKTFGYVTNLESTGSYYQFTADSLATFAFVYEVVKKKGLGFLRFILVLFLLIFVGSRATVLSFTIGMLFSRIGKEIFLSLIIFALSLNVIIQNIDINSTFLNKSRVFVTFYNYSSGKIDKSQSARANFHRQTMNTIIENPFGYDVLYDYKLNGFIGGRAHSVVDIWARYGMLSFFLLLISISGGVAEVLVRKFKQQKPFFLKKLFKSGSLSLHFFLLVHLSFFRYPENIILFYGMGVLSSLLLKIYLELIPESIPKFKLLKKSPKDSE